MIRTAGAVAPAGTRRCNEACRRLSTELGNHELVPIITGGMGVDISTAELALEAARLGGIGHISDAMIPTVSDRRFRTRFVNDKQKQYKYNVANRDKSEIHFDLGHLAEATRHARRAHDGGQARRRAHLHQHAWRS